MELKEEQLARAISAFPRRQILRLLASKELTVKDIALQTNQSVSLASRHLKLLYDFGLLNVQKRPPQKFYSLKIKEINQLLSAYDQVLSKI